MKKVFLLLILGAVIGYLVTAQQPFLLAKVQQYSPVKIPFVEQQVAGASTSAIPNFSLVQKELSKLNNAEIATASPQMKTIINLLQKLPKGQIRMVCQNVCNGIR